MTSLWKTLALTVALGCLATAQPRQAEAAPLRAFLSGDEESPPVHTRAIGVASLDYDTGSKILSLESSVLMLSTSDLITFDIHLDDPALPTGPVILSIGVADWIDFTMVTGIGLVYSVDLSTTVLDPFNIIPECTDTAACISLFEQSLLSNRTYLNLGMGDGSDGAVSGQIENLALVPEPNSLLLMGMGLLGLQLTTRRTS